MAPCDAGSALGGLAVFLEELLLLQVGGHGCWLVCVCVCVSRRWGRAGKAGRPVLCVWGVCVGERGMVIMGEVEERGSDDRLEQHRRQKMVVYGMRNITQQGKGMDLI